MTCCPSLPKIPAVNENVELAQINTFELRNKQCAASGSISGESR